MIEPEPRNLLSATCELQGRAAEARELVRNRYRREEPELENSLRISVDGLLAMLASRLSDEIPCTNEGTSYQIGLAASFIRSHYLIVDLVMNGDLIESLSLVRKQLESLARMHELKDKPLQKVLKKTPNVQNALKGEAGRLYGTLSEVAHFSTPRVSELMGVVSEDTRCGPSLIPRFNKQAFPCMDMETLIVMHFIPWLIEMLEAWHGDGLLDQYRKLYVTTLMIATEAGVLQVPQDS